MKTNAISLFKRNRGLQKIISEETGLKESVISRTINGKASSYETKFTIYEQLIKRGLLKVGEIPYDKFFELPVGKKQTTKSM